MRAVVDINNAIECGEGHTTPVTRNEAEFPLHAGWGESGY